jgi:hypothetical protein
MNQDTAERLKEVADECQDIGEFLMQISSDIDETLLSKKDTEAHLARLPQILADAFSRATDRITQYGMRKALDIDTE